MKYLTYEHRLLLIEILKKHCPIDMGVLKHSINIVQMVTNGFIVVISIEDNYGTNRESSKYALNTNIYTHNSGWIERACQEWRDKIKMEVNVIANMNMNGDDI